MTPDLSATTIPMAPNPDSNDTRRAIRSYVLRGGRLTEGQSRAMDELWPRFGVQPGEHPVDLHELFGRHAPLVVEIGFGNGEATWQMASSEPGKNFIGIEVHPPGVGRLLLALDEHKLGNVRIARTDAVEFLERALEPACIDELRIYFPDPWPKKRHHKRRMIQPEFLQQLESGMRPGGLVHIATDWQPYAEHIHEVFSGNPRFVNLSSPETYCPARPSWRPATKYELRGQRLGHQSFDLLYRFDPRREEQEQS